MTATGRLVPGWNPIRHECETQGCWNKVHRPRIELFAGALPRKISMTDLDATVEVNGSFLFLEWKSYAGEIPTGQRIYFERLTSLSEKITAVVVAGNPELDTVEAIQTFSKGKARDWEECDLEGLFERIKRWSSKVDIRTVPSRSAA